ncbi:MAG: glycine C-acetyltransferase [Caldicoprobacterales bacterium]|jgi:glycine C-acetyltransferase|nr:glycine C-acetyltransferase [Clostridiales bacterium]
MKERLYTRTQNRLQDMKEAGTYKDYRYLESPMGAHSQIEDKGDVLVLCSNNYLGLADKEELVQSGIRALEKYGAGGASVRFICGTYDIHRELEKKVAEFLGTEAALTYTSCWNANTAVIPALLQPGDTVISDELNHASIVDGCRLVARGVNKVIYRHSDMDSLEEKLQQAKDSPVKLVITDGVFSMEGDIAKLPEIVELVRKYDAILLVDDSHATGVIGKTGRGTEEYYNMTGQVDIITGTFGKALGGAGGGFVAGRKEIIDLCVQVSRPHLFSNSLPPVLTAIASAALDYLTAHPEIVDSLRAKTNYFRKQLKERELNILEGDSAIIPIMIYDAPKAVRLANKLFEHGIYVTGFSYPVVPEGQARIRLQVSDALSYEDIDWAADLIHKLVKE